MVEIRSKTLTPECIKKFGNAIDNFATDESTNSDYAFDFVSSESGINFISPEGKINNELEKIIKVIRSCETHNECMKLQNTSNDVFDNLIGGGDNMVTGKNYIYKKGVINGIIINQILHISKGNGVMEQLTDALKQQQENEKTGNVHF